MRTHAILIGALLAWPAVSGAAPAPSTHARAPMVARAPIGMSATHATTKAASHGPARTHAKPKSVAKEHDASTTANASAGPRKLQDIHIEGEIPVPQVLFITARDQRRFVDFQQRRYLRTSRELAEQTNFPSRISLVGNSPSEARKETP
jgi:hypothetical protein